MIFMNAWDIENAQRRYSDHPVLGLAVETLTNLADWANQNSDGWAYWPRPARAAARLIELIQRGDATPEELRKALVPIKALRTRMMAQGLPAFDIRVAP